MYFSESQACPGGRMLFGFSPDHQIRPTGLPQHSLVNKGKAGKCLLLLKTCSPTHGLFMSSCVEIPSCGPLIHPLHHLFTKPLLSNSLPGGLGWGGERRHPAPPTAQPAGPHTTRGCGGPGGQLGGTPPRAACTCQHWPPSPCLEAPVHKTSPVPGRLREPAAASDPRHVEGSHGPPQRQGRRGRVGARLRKQMGRRGPVGRRGVGGR